MGARARAAVRCATSLTEAAACLVACRAGSRAHPAARFDWAAALKAAPAVCATGWGAVAAAAATLPVVLSTAWPTDWASAGAGTAAQIKTAPTSANRWRFLLTCTSSNPWHGSIRALPESEGIPDAPVQKTSVLKNLVRGPRALNTAV